jgi:hypothetical protein
MNEAKGDFQESVAILDEPCDVEATSLPFGKRWRQQVVTLTAEHLQSLQHGKYLAVDVEAEYVVFLCMEGRKEAAHGG